MKPQDDKDIQGELKFQPLFTKAITQKENSWPLEIHSHFLLPPEG